MLSSPLRMKDWYPMKNLNDIFSVTYGNQFDLNKMSLVTKGAEGAIAFVSRKSTNLGIVGFVEKWQSIEPYRPGTITVALGGAILSSHIQPTPYYTGQNIMVLVPRRKMSFSEKLWWCMCIEENAYRYSAFGREANRTLPSLLVPDEPPAWVGKVAVPVRQIESLIHSLPGARRKGAGRRESK